MPQGSRGARRSVCCMPVRLYSFPCSIVHQIFRSIESILASFLLCCCACVYRKYLATVYIRVAYRYWDRLLLSCSIFALLLVVQNLCKRFYTYMRAHHGPHAIWQTPSYHIGDQTTKTRHPIVILSSPLFCISVPRNESNDA